MPPFPMESAPQVIYHILCRAYVMITMFFLIGALLGLFCVDDDDVSCLGD